MPWVQAVPLSDLPVWKIKLQNDGGAIVLRGVQPAARTRLRSHTCRLRGVFCHAPVAAKNGSRLFAAVRGGKVCDAVSRPRGAGLGEQDWWIFEPNESVLFDNFNASRLRARNVGGALSILRIAK